MAGGRNLPGGLVVDFILPDYRVYLRVQGAYWHGAAGQMARDDMQKVMLTASQGYRVVDIYTPDILRDPNLALDLSLGVLV
jgi:very-short-patch-repair endonuclease